MCSQEEVRCHLQPQTRQSPGAEEGWQAAAGGPCPLFDNHTQTSQLSVLPACWTRGNTLSSYNHSIHPSVAPKT